MEKSRGDARENGDGTVSFLTIDPGLRGFAFVMAANNNKQLITRDGQHVYTYVAK